MATNQSFGGPWTVEKLDILSEYLNFYVTALKKQPFDLLYIDAFAGTGQINIYDSLGEKVPGQISISDICSDIPKVEIIPGSAKLALQTKEQFSHYYFIEKKKKNAEELEQLIDEEFSDRKNRIDIIKGRDCNMVLHELCQAIDWHKNRAVLFLDPFAADVKWSTLKIIAETHAIDVWYLFPFSAVNRMMPKNGLTDETWKEKLNSIFGDNSWESEFYVNNPQISLFDDISVIKKNVNNDRLKAYIEKRLNVLFPKVSTHSRVLYNSKKSPLFLFCFAVSNPDWKAQGLALRVADFILQNKD